MTTIQITLDRMRTTVIALTPLTYPLLPGEAVIFTHGVDAVFHGFFSRKVAPIHLGGVLLEFIGSVPSDDGPAWSLWVFFPPKFAPTTWWDILEAYWLYITFRLYTEPNAVPRQREYRYS